MSSKLFFWGNLSILDFGMYTEGETLQLNFRNPTDNRRVSLNIGNYGIEIACYEDNGENKKYSYTLTP